MFYRPREVGWRENGQRTYKHAGAVTSNCTLLIIKKFFAYVSVVFTSFKDTPNFKTQKFTMSQPEVNEFKGWMGKDPSAAKGNLVYDTYKPKPFTSKDVQMKISHCGICGSDIHTLRSGWGPTNYPCVVGHESEPLPIELEIRGPC